MPVSCERGPKYFFKPRKYKLKFDQFFIKIRKTLIKFLFKFSYELLMIFEAPMNDEKYILILEICILINVKEFYVALTY